MWATAKVFWLSPLGIQHQLNGVILDGANWVCLGIVADAPKFSRSLHAGFVNFHGVPVPCIVGKARGGGLS
jgi:hypothetical protein